MDSSGFVQFLGKGVGNQQEWSFRITGQPDRDGKSRIGFIIYNPAGGRGVDSDVADVFAPGQWIHLVGVADGRETRIYRNGVQADCDQYAANADPKCDQHGSDRWIAPTRGSAPFRIGTQDFSSYFTGAIGELRIWNRALTADEIAKLYRQRVVPRDGLSAEYLFNEGSGTVAADTAGSNNATLTGVEWTRGQAPSTPSPAPTATPIPTSVLAPAPLVMRDARYFEQTGFRIDDDAIYGYFQARGLVETFGFPVSRSSTLFGCQVQIFQRQIAQRCGNSPQVQLVNALDPEIFPYTRLNGSVLPGPDDGLKSATPRVGDPNYATAILEFVRANAPDDFLGQPVNFGKTLQGSVSPQQAGTDNPGLIGLLDLEIWGAPISKPQPDPTNSSFIYQRFQRGIMHYTAGQGTRGILLADYVKQILLGPAAPNLPSDLADQARSSKLFGQYCSGKPRSMCRPDDLPTSDLTYAFEKG